MLGFGFSQNGNYQNPRLQNPGFELAEKGSNAIGGNAKSGWTCTEGWDAVTGLGTPQFSKLQAVVQGPKKHVKISSCKDFKTYFRKHHYPPHPTFNGRGWGQIN